MNNKHKMLLLTLCAVVLAAAAIFGTLAYLTDAEAATNTFTVGSVGLTLDEAEVNTDGTLKSEKRVQKNEYHLLPGHTYVKDPTATVTAGSENAYVRMMVTVTYLNEADAVLADHNYQNWFKWDEDSCWIAQSAVTTTKTETHTTRTYEFRYKEMVEKAEEATKLDALFTEITVPGEITNAELKTLKGLEINVVAHAIQAAGFADADAAWAAFDAQVNA